MKVALITSWPPELCGIASNSVNVVNHKAADVEYKIIEGCAWARPFTEAQVLNESQDCDIVHLSYERNLHAGLSPAVFHRLREQGKKLVITYHNVWPGDHQDDNMLAVFDAIVSQDPASPAERGFIYIPQGVMEITPSERVERKLGTAGFPTAIKGGHLVAQVARTLGLGMLIFAPTSRHADAVWMANEIRKQVPEAEIVHDFLPQEVVATRLSECLATVWAYGAHGAQSGISGSVRLGLAARRPIVVSRCGMYRDLWYKSEHSDEICWLESEQPTVESMLPAVEEAIQEKKRPLTIARDMSWVTAGEKYAEVYRKLLQ